MYTNLLHIIIITVHIYSVENFLMKIIYIIYRYDKKDNNNLMNYIIY